MFDPIVVGPDATVRGHLLDVLAGAVRAIDPRRAVGEAVRADGAVLSIGGERIPLPTGRIMVLALGKAALGMAWGAADALDGHHPTGLIATPDPGPAPPGFTVVRGSHPIPDDDSLLAGEALLSAARAAGRDDLVLVLVSGGGSACAEYPAAPLSIRDLGAVTAGLLASGAPIEEVNVVRRRLSLIKGGGLARAVAPARLASLVVSDVIGNDLPTIAGGPTVADPSASTDALGVLQRRGMLSGVAPTVVRHLRSPAETAPTPRGPVMVIADGAAAARGAADAAGRIGIPARVAGTALSGEASLVGAGLAEAALADATPGMAIYAGETTVIIGGAGVGGRNQELALAAALELAGHPDVIVASLGTDGVDGTTDAAGGAVDGATVARGRALGLDAAAALAENDSGTYLAAVEGRLVTGPTGTNVGDVVVTWRLRGR